MHLSLYTVGTDYEDRLVIASIKLMHLHPLTLLQRLKDTVQASPLPLLSTSENGWPVSLIWRVASG